MLEGKDDTEKWLDGNPKVLNFAGSEFRVWAAAESGKIDLNAASAELLKGLLETAGVHGEENDALGDAILDPAPAPGPGRWIPTRTPEPLGHAAGGPHEGDTMPPVERTTGLEPATFTLAR